MQNETTGAGDYSSRIRGCGASRGFLSSALTNQVTSVPFRFSPHLLSDISHHCIHVLVKSDHLFSVISGLPG
ncbi:hypothetical protein L596_024507 [Steinernema carpocapsae]|uniref:Uncharacterized protein n=1 Tax=Steinernema carpocapsae TaxID=34508 RepID=A0A4U5MH91_STECR|nr:hypothetical protein L596_024507 [Steinernema carpocapsae]